MLDKVGALIYRNDMDSKEGAVGLLDSHIPESGEGHVLQQGQYGKVSLVADAERHQAKIQHSGRDIKDRLFRLIRGEGFLQRNLRELTELDLVVSSVLNKGAISREDLDALPHRLSYADQIRLANVFAGITGSDNARKFRRERKLGRSLPGDCGLILSDLIEIMPAPLTARMLYAASNPDIAIAIGQGAGTLDIRQSDDVQVSAIEAVVLLPKKARWEVFGEMSKLGSGSSGRAYKFFAFLAANWADRLSNYNAQRLIERNLPADQMEQKIQEVALDLPELGAFLRKG